MNDDQFLKRAFEIAGKVDPHAVAPNPRVGCVVTTDQRNNGSTEQCIISEGVHEVFGGAHAEVNALGSINNIQYTINNCTVYLTLEPCDHFPGKKTGSCADLLIQARPKRVVIGAPDPRFGGKSLERLRGAGIEVDVCPPDKGEWSRSDQGGLILNPFFNHYQKTGRPWITLKVAQSLDGRITLNANNASKERLRYITNEKSRKEVHRMRAQYSAILTTTETVLQDDPALNCRLAQLSVSREQLSVGWQPSDPKVVIVGRRKIPKESRIWNLESRREIVQFETLEAFLSSELYLNLDSIMTECGSTLNAILLQQGLVDEIRMFVSPKVFGEGKLAFGAAEPALLPGEKFRLESVRDLEGDLEMRYIRERMLDKPA